MTYALHKDPAVCSIVHRTCGQLYIGVCVCLCDAASASACNLCLLEDWDSELGVQNFPRKPVKKALRVERTLVCVLQRQCDGETQYLLTQRPNKGTTLLLNLQLHL